MISHPSLRVLGMAGLVLLLSACASSPLATDDQAIAPFGPAHVLSGEAAAGERVVWGGRIAAVRNLAEFTELTIVSYPLDRADRPRVQSEPGVRFLLRQQGFLEPVQYTPGRFLSVRGTVAGLEQTPVGEHWLELPVLEAEQLHLWPADVSQWQSQTRFNIGIGISL